jgi:hypothetical protein
VLCYNSPSCCASVDSASEHWFASFSRITAFFSKIWRFVNSLSCSRAPRPKLDLFDRLFWVLVRRCWSSWKQALLVVTPETVVRWHSAGFRCYWRVISKVRKPVGRRQTSKEVRDLIFQMMAENPSWGAPRIHGELRMLGFDVSERTISRWMKRTSRNPDPAKRWLAFLRNHREAIAAMDFFTVPDGYLQPALLLLCHQSQSPTYCALQRHTTSHELVDCAAVAGGVSV